jgi:Fe-S cluster biogenesis protein NfuA
MSDGHAAVEALIEAFRPGFQSDGADLVLDRIADGVADIRLIYGPNACVECVLPPDALAEHLMAMLDGDASGIRQIRVREERPA